MTTFQKIPGPYIRDHVTNKLTGEWSSPELALLHGAAWELREKIDGTNIRIYWDGYRVEFRGRTDRAIIPAPLLAFLEEKYGSREAENLFEQKFGETPAVLYGEGFGPKINGGGKYVTETSFILFDVRIDDMYLLRDSVVDIGDYFTTSVVPLIGTGTLNEGIIIVSKGFKSTFGDFWAEGLVAVTESGLLNRRGERIITKIKHVDFYNG